MADGRVVIDVILEDGKVVKGVADIDGKLQGLTGSAGKANRSFMDMVKALGLVKLAGKAFDMLKSSIDGAVSRYDTMNNFPKVMDQLGFSTKDSSKAIDKLADGTKGLPTTLDGITASTQKLAIMTGDLDGSVDTALALNNAFIASGASQADAARGLEQYVQMLSKGEVDLQSWRTLQETMGVALNDVAKSFGFAGKSAQNDLYAALQDGTITFDEFNTKIVELDGGVNGFAERARTASGGIATSFANMKTAIVRGVEGIIRSIDVGLAQAGLGSIQSIIESIGSTFESALKKISSSIPSVIGKLGELGSSLKDAFDSSIIMPNIEFASTFVKQSVDDLVDAIKERVPNIKSAFGNIFSTVGAVFERVVVVFVRIRTTFTELASVLIPLIIDIATALIEGFMGVFGPVIENVTIFAEALVGVLTEAILTYVVPALEKMVEWVRENEELIKLLGAAIAGAVLAFAAFKTVGAIIAGVKTAIMAVTGAFAALNFVMSANPIGLIVVAIGALIGVLIYLWKTNEGFRNGVKKVWNAVKDTIIKAVESIVKAWESMKKFASDLWKGTKELASNAWNGAKDGVTNAVKGIVDAWESFKDKMQEVWDAVKEVSAQAWEAITEAIMEKITPFIEVFMNTWEAMSEGLSMIWEGISNIAEGAWELIKNVILTPVLMLVDLITGDFEGMASHLSQIWENIKEAASLIWEGIKLVLSGYVTAIVDGAVALFGMMRDKAVEIWDNIKERASEIWTSIKTSISNLISNTVEAGKSLWEGFKNWLSSTWESIKQTASNAWENVKETIKSKIENAKKIAINAVKGIAKGLSDAWNDAKKWTEEAFDKVKEIIKSVGDIDLYQIGKDIIQGLINGVTAKATDLWDKVTGIADGIKERLTSALNIHSPSRWSSDFFMKNVFAGMDVGAKRYGDMPAKSLDRAAENIKVPFMQAESFVGSHFMRSGPNTTNNTRTTNNTTNHQDYKGLFDGATFTINSKEDVRELMEEFVWITQTEGARLE